MLIKNETQKRILFATTGIDSWNSAAVANAIIRRISRQETIRISQIDVTTINRMAEVLHLGGRFDNPFRSLAIDLNSIEVETKRILSVFK